MGIAEDLLNGLRPVLESERRYCKSYPYQTVLSYGQAVEAKVRDAMQAKIDLLMSEYCPEEMTDEQLAEWARHQRGVNPDSLGKGGE